MLSSNMFDRHLGGHWSLLILCNFGGRSRSQPITQFMLLLDSLRTADPMRFEPLIRKFVRDIYEQDTTTEFQKRVAQIPLPMPKVPQQRNQTDCGFFMLYYIYKFIQAAPASFTVSNGCHVCVSSLLLQYN